MTDMTTDAHRPLDEQIEQANESGHLPVVFIHGLWLLPSSWDRWAALFADAGYAPLSPGWPDDPDTSPHGPAHPVQRRLQAATEEPRRHGVRGDTATRTRAHHR
jgi:hypothetical protein